jgi:hypothetical protein
LRRSWCAPNSVRWLRARPPAVAAGSGAEALSLTVATAKRQAPLAAITASRGGASHTLERIEVFPMVSRDRAHSRIWVAVALLASTAAVTAAGAYQSKPAQIQFPKEYRGWNHAKTMIIKPGHALASPFEGLHNIFVNDKGLEAHKKGSVFPDGSMLVFDLHAVNVSEDAVTTGKRKFVGVMLKDSGQFAGTGGWGFEVFDAAFKPTQADSKGCYECHAQNDKSDGVFSRFGD